MTTTIQNNFVGGEISPSLFARSDLEDYYKAAATIENFVVSREGSLKKRRGIGAICPVYHSFSTSHLIPYIYDRTELGIVVLFKDALGVRAELRTKNNLSVQQDAVVVYDTTTVSDSQMKLIHWTQIGDTFFLSLKSVFLKKLVIDWSTKTMTVTDFAQASLPDPVLSITATKSTEAETGRNIQYGAYVVRGGVISNVKTVSIAFPTIWPAGAYIDVTVEHGLVIGSNDFDYVVVGKKTGSFFGELCRWYPEDVTGATVTFRDENHTPGDVIYTQTNVLGKNFKAPLATSAFQQRFVMANAANGTTEHQMSLWFSEIGNLYNFYADRPASDDDPFSPTIMATGPAFIRWLMSYQQSLVVFTDTGIFSVAGSANDGFSATTCRITKLTAIPVSQTIRPLETEAGLVFVAADDKTLYSIAYDPSTDSTRPIHRMLRVKHLTREHKFTAIALQQYPDQVIWATLSDGSFLSFTFEMDEKVFAWTRHGIDSYHVLGVIGANTVTDSTTDHSYGDVIFAIRRTDDDTSFYLAKFHTGYSDTVEAFSTPVVARLVTLPFESREETIAFTKKNVKDVMLHLHESGPVSVVPAASGLTPQTVASGTQPYTGRIKVMPSGYISDLGQLTFVSDTATNAEVLSVITNLEVG